MFKIKIARQLINEVMIPPNTGLIANPILPTVPESANAFGISFSKKYELIKCCSSKEK